MTDQPFVLALDQLQPSQLYINATKLAVLSRRVESSAPGSIDPIPIVHLDGRIVMTDGHTRALLLYLIGYETVFVVWDHDDLDLDAYRACVDWCLEEDIQSIDDLAERIVSAEVFDELWLSRCQHLHGELEARRRKAREEGGES